MPSWRDPRLTCHKACDRIRDWPRGHLIFPTSLHGWFLSDFWLFYHLLHPVCIQYVIPSWSLPLWISKTVKTGTRSTNQIWLTCEEPRSLVEKYGEYAHSNPLGDRLVVLEKDMIYRQAQTLDGVISDQNVHFSAQDDDWECNWSLLGFWWKNWNISIYRELNVFLLCMFLADSDNMIFLNLLDISWCLDSHCNMSMVSRAKMAHILSVIACTGQC